MIQDTQEKRELYRQYIRTLDEMVGRTYKQQSADELYEELFEDDCENYWIDIQYCEQTVGFFTICTPPGCPQEADFFLRDAFISPQYRRKGLMKQAVTQWIKEHPGVYSLIVLNNNTPAYNCWMNIFKKCDYFSFEIDTMGAFEDIDSITVFGFMPKRRKHGKSRKKTPNVY